MNRWYVLVVLSPILGLAVDCLSQIVIARASRLRGPYASLSAGILIGLVVCMAITSIGLASDDVAMADKVAFVLMNLASYLALAFGYFNFVNLTLASLRIRLLAELLSAGGSLPKQALLAGYNSERVIEIRLDRLLKGGHLVERNGLFYIGKRGFLAIALVYNVLRRVFIGPWPAFPGDVEQVTEKVAT